MGPQVSFSTQGLDTAKNQVKITAEAYWSSFKTPYHFLF
jgi:hypothetical protein